MGYDIRAFIAKTGTFNQIKLLSPCITIAPLNQGMELLLNDFWFREFLASEDNPGANYEEFSLTAKQLELALQLSHDQPIAYIEADFFGGNGEQSAIVWHNGQVVLLPENNGVFDGIPDSNGPINSVLRFLGIEAQLPHDEFDNSGIARHRHTEDWFKTYNLSPNKKDCEIPGN